MILLRVLRQFETNYVRYEIHFLKHLNHIFLCLAFMISSYHQDSWQSNYFQAVLFKFKSYSCEVVTRKHKDLF